MKKIELVELFIPLMALVQDFRNSPHNSAENLSGFIDSQVNQSRTLAHYFNLTDEFEKGLFAISAWVDEVLLGLEWEGKHKWEEHFLLQMKFYNITNAGELFYIKLSALNDDDNEVRMIYLYCLYLGFTGRYGFHHLQHELEDLRNTHLSMLILSESELNGELRLFPSCYEHKMRAAKWKSPFRYRVLIFLGAIFIPFILLNLMFYALLWRQSLSIL